MMSPRTRRVMGLLAAVAIVVSACGNAASPSAAPSQAASAGASAAPSQAASAAASPSPAAATSGDFRFALDGEPTYFSPSSNDLPTSWIDALIYTALYRANNKGDVVPDLASAPPTISADGLTWTIPMRTDTKWQDGSPITSADALFTFQIALSSKCSFNPTTCSTWHDNVASVTAPDAASVVVVLKAKYAPFFLLGLASTLIVPKAYTEASYQRFVAGSAQADAAAVKKLADSISTAQGDAGCAADPVPETCNSSHYTADMEATLTKAGITLPDKNRYLDATSGQVDPAGYGDALLVQLTDLNTTLQAGETDKIAAAYRLLDLNLNPIGSGAYKFGNYQPGSSVELDRNDLYYLFTPGPAKVLIPIIKDAAAASQALASNQIDWQTEITSSDALASLKSNPAVKLSEFPDLGYYFIAFNVRPGHVFSDVVARQAFSMCIDQAQTVTAATESNGTPVKAEVPPASFFFNPDVPEYKLDVAGAKALLEKNGYTLTGGVYAKAGVKLSVDLFVRSGRPQRVQFAQLAKDQLSKCGININVKESDFATVLLPLLSYPNKFDIYLGGWANLLDPEDSNIFGCAHVTTAKNPDDNNFTGYCDPKVDDLLTQAKQETDRTKRKQILGDLQLYLHDNGPYYFLWADVLHRGYSANVDTNGKEGPIDYTTFYDFWNNDSWIIKQQ